MTDEIMTEEELQKIKEHIEIHARKEPHAVKITQILWKAVEELESTKELQEEIKACKFAMVMSEKVEKQLREQNDLLQKENGRLKKDSEETQDLATIAHMQGAGRNKAKLDEAKVLLSALLKEEKENMYWVMDGSDKSSYFEIVKRAEAFLKEASE